MKVFVTGSNGFVGKRLCGKLKQRGFDVKGFDFSTGKNILDKNQLLLEMQDCEMVYHLAAVLDEDGKKLFEVNVEGTKNVLFCAEKLRVKHFVFTSTVGVMGDITGVADEQTPQNPKTSYEKSKAQAETAVLSYQEALPVTVVRPAIVIGPNKDWEKIIEMVKKNYPLIGDGLHKFQSIYVDDLADALAFIGGKDAAIGETFIVAEDAPKTLRELTEFIRKKTGVKGTLKTIPVWLAKAAAHAFLLISKITGKKPFFTPEIIDRTVRLRHYSTKKINGLGWHAKTDAFGAIEKTIEAFKKH